MKGGLHNNLVTLIKHTKRPRLPFLGAFSKAYKLVNMNNKNI